MYYDDEMVKKGTAMDFDKTILYNNLSYLIQQNNLKIGEFESEAGVSPGYISRTLKDGNTKPGIDFIMNAAEILNVGIDNLLKWDMTTLSNTERDIVDFLVKLNQETTSYNADWKVETVHELNDLAKNDNPLLHPLLSAEEFVYMGGGGYPESFYSTVFISNTYGKNTELRDDSYTLRLGDSAYLLLMNFGPKEEVFEGKKYDVWESCTEIWMYLGEHGAEFICATNSSACIDENIQKLLLSIKESFKHLKISSEARSVINTFMLKGFSDN